MKKGLKVVLIGALVCSLCNVALAKEEPNFTPCEIPTDIRERYDVVIAGLKERELVDMVRKFREQIANFWGSRKLDKSPYHLLECGVLEKAYREAYQQVYDYLSGLKETKSVEELLYNPFQGGYYEATIQKKQE